MNSWQLKQTEKLMKTLFKFAIVSLIVCIILAAYTIITRIPVQHPYEKFVEDNPVRKVMLSDAEHDHIADNWNAFLKSRRNNKLIAKARELHLKELLIEHRGKITREEESEDGSDIIKEDGDEEEEKLLKNKQIKYDRIDPATEKLKAKLARLLKLKKKTKVKIILLYTGLHNSEEYYNLPRNKTKFYLKRTKCPNTKCHVTYDKQLLPIADAVIFHERNMPSVDALKMISKPHYRSLSQRWIYFTSETPKNSATNAIPYNTFFNWTMTYRKDSDIFLPYLQYRKLKKYEKRPPANINYAKKKKNTTAWLVGNCKFGFRMKFAHLLEKETSVYVGGDCRYHFDKLLECSRYCNESILKEFKFFLAFENGICRDYITEKYWKYLDLGLVPVVLGGANYSDPSLAIPGSFIDASKFKSVKELAKYLDYLDKNDRAYNEYFKWKQKYKIWHPIEGDWPFESYFLCEICKKLHQKLPAHTYWKLSNFWNIHSDCQMPEDILTERFIPKGFGEKEIDEDEKERMRHFRDNIPKDFDEDYQ